MWAADRPMERSGAERNAVAADVTLASARITDQVRTPLGGLGVVAGAAGAGTSESRQPS